MEKCEDVDDDDQLAEAVEKIKMERCSMFDVTEKDTDETRVIPLAKDLVPNASKKSKGKKTAKVSYFLLLATSCRI
jgi:Mg2+/Co2+ transporter CorC